VTTLFIILKLIIKSYISGQCGFSRAMMKIVNDPSGNQKLHELCSTDATFQEAFDYLISDMNSHPKHLFYYLKAILVNYYKKKYHLTDEILSGESLREFEGTFEKFLGLFEVISIIYLLIKNLNRFHENFFFAKYQNYKHLVI